jgi:hypothetical protein
MKITLWTNGKATGAKMGRKREDGPREPNGRLQREAYISDSQKAENQRVAREQRIRIFGVSEKDALDQKAATVHGRLCLLGPTSGGISLDQYHTAERYLTDRNAYMRAISAKVEYQERGGLTDPDPEAYERFCHAAIERMKWYRETVFEAMEDGRMTGNPIDAADALWQILVIQNTEAQGLIPDLRTVLNIIQQKDGAKTQRRAA